MSELKPCDARKIYNVCSVQIENSVTPDNCSCLVMPKSYYRGRISNLHLTIIKYYMTHSFKYLHPSSGYVIIFSVLIDHHKCALIFYSVSLLWCARLNGFSVVHKVTTGNI